jgi:hypothetical protein
MIKYLSIAGHWCRIHRKLFLFLFALFILLSCALLDFACVLARSSHAPTIRVRAIDADTGQPIKDAIITVNYNTGILNSTTKIQECRITDTNGEAEFEARMIWAYWIVPDVYTGATVFFQHYYYSTDGFVPTHVIAHQRYFANPVNIEARGKHIDRLGTRWIQKLYENMELTFQTLIPKYYEISPNGPQVAPVQILQKYEATFNTYASGGIERVMEMQYRNKFAELKTRRY